MSCPSTETRGVDRTKHIDEGFRPDKFISDEPKKKQMEFFLSLWNFFLVYINKNWNECAEQRLTDDIYSTWNTLREHESRFFFLRGVLTDEEQLADTDYID